MIISTAHFVMARHDRLPHVIHRLELELEHRFAERVLVGGNCKRDTALAALRHLGTLKLVRVEVCHGLLLDIVQDTKEEATK
ncbi:MAG: hypothetical protein ACKPKO_07535 [Candidatus Fonsibacter sp.]